MSGGSERERPETDPAQAQPGERACEDLPVRGVPQGPGSAGASEPPHEHPRADGGGCRG